MSHLIELKKVSKFYAGRDTVSTGFARVDLALDTGEFVAITGESGSGKSTLINVISGLDTYEEGVMLVNGEDTSGYVTKDYERYRKECIGNIFQDFNLIGSYTVYQNIELAMLLAGKKAGECKARIRELIELVDLTKYTNVKVSKLSGGQKQRVAIARVLSKDAPIIVADEPTGNLDSVSAAKVIETLGKISRDKLVIVVTHNYEQVEPYVTRKITMHDGRIIEDKRLAPARAMDSEDLYDSLHKLAFEHPESFGGQESAREEVLAFSREKKAVAGKRGKSRNITAGSQFRLGIRNTFNLPAKFLLLLLVYVFVSTSVLSQYSSTKNSVFETENLGWNWYFTDTDASRVILTKKDGKAFNDEDAAAISALQGVDRYVETDVLIDSTSRLRANMYELSGPTLPIGTFDESNLTYGRMPKSDYEIVIECDENSFEYSNLKDNSKDFLNKEYWLDAEGNISVEWGTKVLSHKLKVVGIAVKKEASTNYSGNINLYLSDTALNRILTKTMASLSSTRITCNDKRIDTQDYQVIYSSDEVPKAEVYIFEDYAYQLHDEGKVLGKDFGIRVSNVNFVSRAKLEVGQIITEKNIESLLGIEKKKFGDVSGRVYVNSEVYDKLFNKGSYQATVYVKNPHEIDKMKAALEDMGYTPFVMRESLVTSGGDFIKIFSVIMFAAELVLLFFVAYAVIRLIMRSRNTYYSTLRILGANKKHTDNVLKIELCAVMTIAYGLVLGFAAAVSKGLVDIPQVKSMLEFLKVTDYGILLAALLVMSLLIANRYSRALFKKSAMNVYREEA